MRRAPALVAVLAMAAGCSRCGRKEGPPPERHLPADAAVTVVIPSLGPAARQVGALQRTVASVPAASQLAEAWAAVRSQLGFDPLDPKGLEDAGLDASGGAAASFAPGRPPLLVLPVADLGRFDAMALRLARDRMGAAQRVSSMGRGHPVVSYRKDAAAPAALAYAVVGRFALVATGPRGPEVLSAAADLPEERSLQASAEWASARAALGPGFALVAFAPPRSSATSAIPAATDGAALALRAGPASLSLRLALLLGAGRAPGWSALAGEGPEAARQAGQGEARLLAPDAALAVRWGGDLAALGRKAIPFLPSHIQASLQAAHIDLAGELLEALRPGAALSLSLAPSFTLAEFSSPSLDLRRADPFRLVKLEALLRVRDAARARAFFARVGQSAPRWNARLASRAVPGGATIWTLSYGRGQLAWSLAGDRLVVAGGAGRLEALEKRLAAAAGGYEPPGPAAKAALEGGVGGAVLDVENLLESIQALPEEAYGTGPNAFVMRSLADRFLEPASRLRAASLRLDLLPGAALLDLEIEGRGPEVPKP